MMDELWREEEKKTLERIAKLTELGKVKWECLIVCVKESLALFSGSVFLGILNGLEGLLDTNKVGQTQFFFICFFRN